MVEDGTGRPFPRVDPRAVDVLLAAAAVLIGQLDVWYGLSDGGAHGIVHHRGLSSALFAVGLSMLVFRRRAPIPALAVVFATFLIQAWLLDHVALFWGGLVPVLLLVYAVGAHTRGPRAAAGGLVLAIAGVTSVTLAVPDLRSAGEATFDTVLLSVVWGIGWVTGTRTRRTEELADRTARLEHEREHTIADERARLARELHDIVAHSVSVIAVQAEAGEALLDEPERAAEAFRSIQGTSRQALIELRRLLGLLREVNGPPSLAPQPGLREVGELVEQVRAAGLDIELTVEGPIRRLEPGVDLSAYRVVQEALTNALKHAGRARARVSVRYLPDAVELLVTDDGPGAVPPNGNGTGHGLTGIRERVALYGGEVAAGSAPEGGFAVRARLPLEPR